MNIKLPPEGCYCPTGVCHAPKIMGRQTPCLRRDPHKLNSEAQLLLKGLQQQDQRLLDLVVHKMDAFDDLIKIGLAVNDGTRIVDYSYVTSFSLTQAGKEYKL